MYLETEGSEVFYLKTTSTRVVYHKVILLHWILVTPYGTMFFFDSWKETYTFTNFVVWKRIKRRRKSQEIGGREEGTLEGCKRDLFVRVDNTDHYEI